MERPFFVAAFLLLSIIALEAAAIALPGVVGTNTLDTLDTLDTLALICSVLKGAFAAALARESDTAILLCPAVKSLSGKELCLEGPRP